MELNELLTWFDQGGQFGDDPEIVACMRRYIQENRRLLFEMNNLWHEDENEITELFRKITAKPVGEGVRIETPFHTDFGKNITLGNRVFINAGCKFQDQGGIVIGGGSLIGHNVVLATLDHDLAPDKRHILHPAPIRIGNNVWIGAGAVVTKGVTIGDNSVIAAGAVVTRDIPPNVIAAGVPAKVLRERKSPAGDLKRSIPGTICLPGVRSQASVFKFLVIQYGKMRY